MSYRKTIIDDVVLVQFVGYVDGLQLVKMLSEDNFLPNLDKVKKLIFDYSCAEEIDLSLEETKRFATIAQINANFIEHLHIVIVLSSKEGLARAQFYQQSTNAPNWHVDIVETLEQAFQCTTP